MCFSAEASFAAAAALLPAGVVAMQRAVRRNLTYLPIATLPLLFGLQQFSEGTVWMAGRANHQSAVETSSLAYMFFSYFAWPVWVPFSAYFLEPQRRRSLYLMFAISGSMLAGVQYIPYFAHQGWLTTRFYDYAISYQGTVLLDALIPRELTYLIYLMTVILPLIISSNLNLRFFGGLLMGVVAVTYAFFIYAYVSVFCFGGAVMSSFLVWMVFQETADARNSRYPTLGPGVAG